MKQDIAWRNDIPSRREQFDGGIIDGATTQRMLLKLRNRFGNFRYFLMTVHAATLTSGFDLQRVWLPISFL